METGRHSAGDCAIVESSGNVFDDLDLPSSEDDMLKIHIAHAISSIIQKRGLTQVEAGELIGVDQSKISALMRGRLKGLSVERMLGFLNRLGQDVDISIKKTRGPTGAIKIRA